jgi:uncharacterized membrane protein
MSASPAMPAAASTGRARAGWWPAIALVLLSVVPVVAGSRRLRELAGQAAVTAENARFVAQPLPVVVHIVTATVFSVLGAFQFVPALRTRQSGWHRRVGAVLLVSGFLVALSGLWMTLSYPWAPNDGALVYAERVLFGGGMLASLVMAVAAIRRRDFARHGRWMIRAYAIGLGAGTQVLTHLPYVVLVNGQPGEHARALMMGAGWVINVAVAEWIVRRTGAP